MAKCSWMSRILSNLSTKFHTITTIYNLKQFYSKEVINSWGKIIIIRLKVVKIKIVKIKKKVLFTKPFKNFVTLIDRKICIAPF